MPVSHSGVHKWIAIQLMTSNIISVNILLLYREQHLASSYHGTTLRNGNLVAIPFSGCPLLRFVPLIEAKRTGSVTTAHVLRHVVSGRQRLR